MSGSTALYDFLQQVFPMPPKLAEEIVSLFKERSFQKGDFLLKESKVCNDYYFLEEGFARSFIYDWEGNDVTTDFYTERQVVFEIFSFFKRIPSSENIQALTDCKTCFISFEELQKVFHAMPEFREFGRTILVNSIGSLKARMLSLVQETAEERYRKLIATNPHIFHHAALKHIATYLGVTDTSLSRIRKEYARKH